METRARNGQTEGADPQVTWKVLLANTPDTDGIGAEVSQVFREALEEAIRQSITADASAAQRREAGERLSCLQRAHCLMRLKNNHSDEPITTRSPDLPLLTWDDVAAIQKAQQELVTAALERLEADQHDQG